MLAAVHLLLAAAAAAEAEATGSNIPDTSSAALLWPLPRSVMPGHSVSMLAANASFFGPAPSDLLGRAFERYAKLLPTCSPAGASALLLDANVVSSFELRVENPEAPGPAEFMDESYSLLVPSQGPV